ncbi:PREDICTED: uncharacterized protein LOC104814444 [Tarenaya hassleriana]|uniref:uncharacterized protein LOC104814444 n=1 Tax=Tarenaya hassleriana TaxID=28532 RepID=UPI00053C2126|nr:PREDICTED: uncharacterized protein LOC104814444 [Tarenaya hassleriana]
MSLNCLTCHALQRSDSDGDMRRRKDPNFMGKMMRNGSSLPQVTRIKKGHRHRRLYSADAVYEDSGKPRLVRSSGIRRDWSFEDLNKHGDKIIGETVKE